MTIGHLKTRKQFQSMLAHPPVARTSHFCLHRLPVGELARATGDAALLTLAAPTQDAPAHPPRLWVGALLPKRWAKRAVTRNLIRRQVYAVALEHARAADAAATAEAPHEPLAILIRLRAGFHPGPARHGRAKGKAAGKPAPPADARRAATAAVALPVLRSAASPLLKAAVRSQLQWLFTRAAAAPSAGERPS